MSLDWLRLVKTPLDRITDVVLPEGVLFSIRFQFFSIPWTAFCVTGVSIAIEQHEEAHSHSIIASH